MPHLCPNCKEPLQFIDPPHWNAVFDKKQTITIQAHCEKCHTKFENKNVFNNLDEYQNFLDK